jgi:hypothetical protein
MHFLCVERRKNPTYICTIVSYNASVVKIYNTSNPVYLVHFLDKEVDSKTVAVSEIVNSQEAFLFLLFSRVRERVYWGLVNSPFINHPG